MTHSVVKIACAAPCIINTNSKRVRDSEEDQSSAGGLSEKINQAPECLACVERAVCVLTGVRVAVFDGLFVLQTLLSIAKFVKL